MEWGILPNSLRNKGRGRTAHKRAVALLQKGVELQGVFPKPRAISIGTDYSISLQWESDTTELFISIPENPAAPIQFEGTGGAYGATIKGMVDESTVKWLFEWLVTTGANPLRCGILDAECIKRVDKWIRDAILFPEKGGG